jgi:hypothetical protein
MMMMTKIYPLRLVSALGYDAVFQDLDHFPKWFNYLEHLVQQSNNLRGDFYISFNTISEQNMNTPRRWLIRGGGGGGGVKNYCCFFW